MLAFTFRAPASSPSDPGQPSLQSQAFVSYPTAAAAEEEGDEDDAVQHNRGRIGWVNVQRDVSRPQSAPASLRAQSLFYS